MASRNEVFKLTIDVDAEIKNARAAAESLQKSFSKINLSDSIRNNLNKTFTNLEKELTNFETMANKPFKNMGDVQKAEKSFEKITDLFDQLKITAKNIQGMDLEKIMPKDFVRQLDRVKDLYKTVTKEAIEAGREQQKAANNAKKAIADQNKELKELQKTQKELESRQQQHQSDKEFLSGNYKGRAAALKGNVTKAQNQVEAAKEGTVARDIAESEAKNAQKTYNDFIKSVVEAQQREKEWANTHKETETKLKEVNSAIEQANNKIKEQEAIMNAAAESPASLEELRKVLSAISGQDLSQIPTDLKNINEMVATLQADKMREVAKQVGVLASEAEKADPSLKTMDERMKDVHNSGEQLSETASEVEHLSNQVKQFFSIGNTIQLFKRAIRDAMDTVKELDKAMTETATVTNYSIGDMWEQLPRYTEEANKLGTSINSLYKATTLYYQQGLQTNEAMALGIETIKMARVASMDAAQATDLMTAALRGFNMELNEQSAIRINDVYSELAAVTAADTDEIGIAMSKTASIAHSANMEFETTAAFLSQIIETTREAPETAGTAMKTIIARFTEVKKLFTQGQLTGQDEEGQAISINKIDDALKSVGINLKAFLTGEKGLDDILLELASKWDSLDIATQRYIATQAAGSRQQSRFLAMMSDYDRTLELVDAAYDSAGSGQRQFEKTLDSMEAKLSQLKNAWDQFVMGLADNEILKTGVDILTSLLGVINNIISAISGNNGLIKSITSLALAISGLSVGKKLLGGKTGGFSNKILNLFGLEKIKKEVGKQSITIGDKIKEGIGKSFSKGEGGQGLFKTLFSNFKFTKFNADEVFKKAQNFVVSNQDDPSKQDTIKQLQAAGKDYQAISNILKQQGIEIQTNTDFIERNKEALSSWGATLTSVGVLVTVAGNEISKTNESLGETISVIGKITTAAGTAITIIPKIATGLKDVGLFSSISTTALGGWITAIMAVVAGLIALFTAISNNTPEARIKAAQKRTEELGQAASEAQNEYDALKDSIESLKKSKNTLNTLIKGTREWREEIAKINNGVLQLIEKYPTLEYTIEDGVFKISEETYNQLLEDQLNGLNEIVAAYQTSSADATFIEREAILKRTTDQVSSEHYSAFQQNGLDQVYDQFDIVEAVKSVAEKYGGIDLDPNSDISVQLKEISDKVAGYGIDAEEARNIYRSLIENEVDLNNTENKIISQLTTGLSAQVGENRSDFTQQLIEGIVEDNLSAYEDDLKKIREKYEKMSTTELRESYLSQTGQSGEGKTDDQIRDILSRIEINTGYLEVLKTQEALIAGSDLGDQNKVAAFLSGDYSKLSTEELISGDTSFITEEIAKAAGFENVSAAINRYNELIKSAIQANDSKRQELNTNYNIGEDQLKYLEGATLDTLINVFSNLDKTGGAPLSEAFSNFLDKALKGNPEAIPELIKQISGADFSSIEGVTEFFDNLDAEALGIKDVESWKNRILSNLHEINAVDLSGLRDKIKEAFNLADKIEENTTNTVDEETADQLINLFGQNWFNENFGFDGQQFVYIGGQMSDLANAIRDNTAAQQENEKVALQSQIHNAELFKESDYQKATEVGEEDTKGQLEFLQEISENGGIFDNSGKEIDVSSLHANEQNADYIRTLFNQLLLDYENLTSNQKTLEGLDYVNMSATDVRTNGGTTQQQTTAAISEAGKANINIDELLSYRDILMETTELTEEQEGLIIAVALSSMRFSEGLQELSDNWEDINKGLTENTEGTNKYREAINKAKSAIQKMFGLEVNLSDEFIKTAKNSGLLEKAIKGDKKALNDLQKEVAKDILKKHFEELPEDIANIVDEIADIDLEVGDVVNLGDPLADKLMTLYNEAYKAAIEGGNDVADAMKYANQVMAAEGFEPPEMEYKTVTVYGDLPTGWQVQPGNSITGPDGQILQGVKYVTLPGGVYGYEQTIPVPKKGSKGFTKTREKIGDTSGNKKPSGGGGSKKKDSNNWKNPYDKYYNLTEKINEALRTREKIERDYDRILNRRERSVADILKNSEAEIKILKQEVQYQKQLQAGRLDQLKNVASEKYDDDGTLRTFKDMGVTKYARYNFDAQTVEIDWEAIDKVRDERLGKAIEAYEQRLLELAGQFEETQTTIKEMEDNIWEINQRGKQEYLDLEQRVIDALVNEQQKIIDDLSAKFESINEANDNILNSMQEQIDLERQIRDNTKTEDDIAQKEARLAYLRRDTSGANATEIMKLEQDLADARQNYTDTLIDQGLKKLSDENARAAEQRQQQIEVMQAQLDFQKENGDFNEQAATILKSAFDTDGNLKNNSALVDLLKQADNFKSLTEFGQIQWWTDLTTAVKAAIEGGVNFAKEKYNNKNNTLAVKNKNGEEAQIYWDKNKNAWVDAKGNTYDEVNTVAGTYGSMTAVSTPSNNNGSNGNSSDNNETYPYGKASETTGNIGQNSKNTKGVKAIQYALQKLGYDIGNSGVDGKFGPKTKAAVQKFQKDMGLKQDGIVGKNTRAKFKTKGYATGGLADFTGPAWLDGTKAHPELVLNARDTENFIQLKDILSNMGSLDKLQNGGDNYYNFDIKVDQLANDYDVDKLIGKIKNEIDKDARYRNVNSINFIR